MGCSVVEEVKTNKHVNPFVDTWSKFSKRTKCKIIFLVMSYILTFSNVIISGGLLYINISETVDKELKDIKQKEVIMARNTTNNHSLSIVLTNESRVSRLAPKITELS